MNDSGIPTTDVHGVPEQIPADLVVLDVREDHEWAAGHIDGAIHIPLGDLRVFGQEAVAGVDGVGMDDLGGRDDVGSVAWVVGVVNLAGGMDAWEQVGRRVV